MTGKIIKQGINRSKLKSVPPTVTSCCLVAKLWPTLCNPTDHSPPGFSVHGILQARTLEWVAVSFSRASFWPRDWTCSSWGFFTMEPPGKLLSALISRLFSSLLTMGPKNISPLPAGMMSSFVRREPQEEGIFFCWQVRVPRGSFYRGCMSAAPGLQAARGQQHADRPAGACLSSAPPGTARPSERPRGVPAARGVASGDLPAALARPVRAGPRIKSSSLPVPSRLWASAPGSGAACNCSPCLLLTGQSSVSSASSYRE